MRNNPMDESMVPPRRLEMFEVVCVKPDTNPLTATPEGFLRVPVEATDPYAALLHPDVRAKVAEGYTTLFTAKPGVLTDPEILARSRAAQSITFDRSRW